MDNSSFKKFILKRVHTENSTEYAIFEPKTEELVFQSSELAMEEMHSNYRHYRQANGIATPYATVSNEMLDFIVDNGGEVEIKGFYENEIFKPDFIANRVIIKWNRL